MSSLNDRITELLKIRPDLTREKIEYYLNVGICEGYQIDKSNMLKYSALKLKNLKPEGRQ